MDNPYNIKKVLKYVKIILLKCDTGKILMEATTLVYF